MRRGYLLRFSGRMISGMMYNDYVEVVKEEL